MITFERTTDYELVRKVMTHPAIYPHISDDSSPPAAEYRPIEHESVWYVAAYDGAELLGIWMFVPQNAVCWEVHTCVLPSAWGDRGLLAARLLPLWIWANTPCRRIISNVPATNRLAMNFAAKAGMHLFAVNEDSYLKYGQLCDQALFGLSKPQEPARNEAETGLEPVAAIGGGGEGG